MDEHRRSGTLIIFNVYGLEREREMVGVGGGGVYQGGPLAR